MPPVAAALLPHPPLLVPALAGDAAAELDPLRTACQAALSTVMAAADVTVIVGDGPVWGAPEAAAAGSFQPYGVEVEVALPALVDLDLPGLPPPARLAHLPLSLAVAAHLLAGLDPPPARLAAVTVPDSLGPGAAAAIGRSLTAAAQEAESAATPPVALLPAAGRRPPTHPRPSARGAADRGVPGGRVGLVVMGDLSACRTERAPGAFREEAAGFDGSVAEAFRTGHPERLLELDPVQAADLLVAGRVPLQVLAGAYAGDPAGPAPVADERDPARPAQVAEGGSPARRSQVTGGGDPPVGGRVLYDDAPYGVGYLVALLVAP
jgi:hypothetical protein